MKLEKTVGGGRSGGEFAASLKDGRIMVGVHLHQEVEKDIDIAWECEGTLAVVAVF